LVSLVLVLFAFLVFDLACVSIFSHILEIVVKGKTYLMLVDGTNAVKSKECEI
jgi:hypothetical protein